MSGGLLHKLTTVGEDESLSRIFVWWFDPIDELGEDDLGSVIQNGSSSSTTSGTLTVLPLPVASDMPSLLCPFLR